MMQPRANQKGIEFSVEWKGETSRKIRTDPIRVRQILINLVSNAIKFTERGGVTLRVERHFDWIDLSIIDTGIGMSKQQIERVFEPFTQGDSTTTRRFGGSGLGLAISRHLSRLLGGELELRSELGRGSTFRLRLQTLDVPGSEVESESAPPIEKGQSGRFEVPIVLRGKRILVAEDSADIREYLRKVLDEAGMDVTAVGDGKQLLDAALHARSAGAGHDLYLIDMQMPLVDGYEATRRLRQAGVKTPIVAITAHTLESDRQECLGAGCDDYIKKPVRRDVLIQRVATHLGVVMTQPASLPVTESPPIAGDLLDDPIVADLLPVFLGELQRHVVSLRVATAAQDANGVRQVLHNVKGAAATFGFPQLGELAAAANAEMRIRPWGDGFQAAMAQFYDLSARVCDPPASGDAKSNDRAPLA